MPNSAPEPPVDETPTPPRGTEAPARRGQPEPARPEPARPEPARPKPAGKKGPTRLSATWVAVVVAVVLLIFLLVFILQNLSNATVHFLGLSGTLPLGVAMLLSAIAGALLVALVGSARILQLRRNPGGRRRP